MPTTLSRIVQSVQRGSARTWRYAAKRREMAPALRTVQQFIGTNAVGCGATHSIMEKCNFRCTSCYLSSAADYAQPLPFEEVKRQLDVLRAHLGRRGKVQITSGEVTLLAPAALGRIVAYARGVGLDPMVMTNGERLLRDREYLPTLVMDYGLRKISFHIDTTQEGRPGMEMGLRERDVHPIRERFAQLVREVRRATRKPLHAAHTVTVTPRNLRDVPDVVEWCLRNADAFRILSFQPVAEVGRTRDVATSALSMENVWESICLGVGRPLNRHAMHFGHPECNITVPIVVLRRGEERLVVEAVRANRPWDRRLFGRLIRAYAAPIETADRKLAAAGQLLAPLLLRPHLALELVLYGGYRLWPLLGPIARLLGDALRGRRVAVRPLLLVVHKFMSAEELRTPLGRERLAACTFKVPVEGELVSMCEVNATDIRERLNARLVPHGAALATVGR